MLRNILHLLISVLFVLGVIFAQNQLEGIRIKKKDLMYFLPKKEHLIYTTVGFKPIVADLLWFRGVSYFLSHVNHGNDYPYLYGIFDAAVKLDPQFKQVYRDTMTLLISDQEHYHEAEKLMLYGQRQMPKDWEINYLTGVLYQFYLKDSSKSLKFYEKAWGQVPRDEAHQGVLDNITIMIRALTEKENNNKGLVLYWWDKYKKNLNTEALQYSKEQIIKYTSLYVEGVLNQTVKENGSNDEKQKILENEVLKWQNFVNKYGLEKLLEVPANKLFFVCDAYGYPWVYRPATVRFFSYGVAEEYLRRKINLYNVKLWQKAQKYLTLSVDEIVNYAVGERQKHIVLKQEYNKFPALEELFKDLKQELGCESNILPAYDREKCIFKIPTFEDVRQNLVEH